MSKNEYSSKTHQFASSRREMIAGKEIGLKIDQTLCQDATGTLVMLELKPWE